MCFCGRWDRSVAVGGIGAFLDRERGFTVIMQEIVIDEEFKWLLPVLDAETFKLLEENILQNGCRDSLILWGDTLIDGHNRYEICMRHGLPFNTVSKEFDTREACGAVWGAEEHYSLDARNTYFNRDTCWGVGVW